MLCTVCKTRQARFECEELGHYDRCRLPVCSETCYSAHKKSQHPAGAAVPVNTQVFVVFRSGERYAYEMLSTMLGEELVVRHPKTESIVRCLRQPSEEGYYYSEASAPSVPNLRAPQALGPLTDLVKERMTSKLSEAHVTPPPPTRHHENIATAFSLHVGYLLGILEKRDSRLGEALGNHPELLAALEKNLSEVSKLILRN